MCNAHMWGKDDPTVIERNKNKNCKKCKGVGLKLKDAAVAETKVIIHLKIQE